MSAAADYFDQTIERLYHLRKTQSEVIDRAANLCAERIEKGGLIFCFGAGHSRMMCEEMTPRQGGFVGFYALVELALSNHSAIIGPNGLRGPLHLEKVSGYAEEILRGFRFGPHDAFIVTSPGGPP
ncbi:MAG: SIS domain-containing protein, partial [Bacteroidetes bacterium]|nr:SIS domain-containing protein [Bacteroidota bacterium]